MAHSTSAATTTVEAPAPTAAPSPSTAPGPTPGAPAASDPPRATPPTTDELLVLDTVACHVTSGQNLVDCEGRWQALLRTPAAPGWVECTLDDSDVHTHSPQANELWRGSFGAEQVSEGPFARRCTIGSVTARLPASEHRIEALTNDLLAGVPSAGDVDLLGVRDALETGPVRAVIGELSARVRFLSVYLDDLGPLLAIPGRQLLTQDQLRAALDASFTADWPGSWVRGGRKFAPQVEDAKQREGWGYTPTFSTCIADDPSVHSCAFAVPVQATQGRRYLIMATTPMRDPNYRALTRRLLIQRLVEDGLVPTPEAMAYAAAQRAQKQGDGD